ncbi:hypothetical protein Q3G72_027741 [Acer saccharum]|nr:hypothetical protein Q3G72_027741 [Acer saccharum]
MDFLSGDLSTLTLYLLLLIVEPFHLYMVSLDDQVNNGCVVEYHSANSGYYILLLSLFILISISFYQRYSLMRRLSSTKARDELFPFVLVFFSTVVLVAINKIEEGSHVMIFLYLVYAIIFSSRIVLFFNQFSSAYYWLYGYEWLQVGFSTPLHYILGAHLCGSLWYRFAIQAKLDCCHEVLSSCCLNQYDYGIYEEVFRYGIHSHTSLVTKYIFCQRWGLQKLTPMAKYLQSNYTLSESLFVIFIAFTSLLYFVISLGRFQVSWLSPFAEESICWAGAGTSNITADSEEEEEDGW